MKTKLTLTVEESIIAKAKRISKKTGKSLSQMFEEMFSGTDVSPIKSEQQKAAERLFKYLENMPAIQDLGNDKELIRAHRAKKYA